MSNKVDLQRKLKEIGYEIGSFASKDTLSNIIRLHSLAVQNKGVDVVKLSDLDLRKSLTEHGLAVGPVTNHTRSIYQRKLLEVLTNETSEGKEDEIETEIPVSTTPPRTIRSSITRTADNDITSSPGRRLYTQDLQEPRIALTRVDIENKNKHNLSTYYPNVSNTKPKSEQTITHSYSPQRSSTKTESHHSTMSYGLRNPYDFQNDEPPIIRHEHKATPFRTTNISSDEAFSTNTNRYTKQSDIQTIRNDLNEIRSRILTNTNEEKEIQIKKDLIPKKSTFINQSENKKLSNNNEKLNVPVKSSGTFLYSGITIAVALIIVITYQHRITSINLSNPLIINRIFSPISIRLKFTRLENLSLHNVESKYLEELLIHLISLPCLSSLVINCIDNVQNKNTIYHQIFRLPVLKYCKLSLERNIEFNPLSIATSEFSPIEYFIISNKLYIDELNAILTYIPQIRRLSIRNLHQFSKNETIKLYPVVLNYLIHVSMTMTKVTFDEFESIIKTLFHQIQVLFIATKDDQAYLDACRWEELIVAHLPNLQIFDIQYEHCFHKDHHLLDDVVLNKFNSLFWFERKWFFEYYIYYTRNNNHVIFYSINPYRYE
ncbi:unnamed protein product [Rotaria sordida]|uniref:LEM domain-containing protein n=1 Tax=Rotaria sordida TaxID=392033 RepID=A0A814TMT3_9BILA|nr:unnamed protein product [Rotaria sordida]CAF3767854.1 unnamed protein product [Rotaria sordida]